MSIRAFSACTMVLAIAPALFAGDAVLIEQIVAKVNGDIITRSELDQLRKQLAADLQQRGGTPSQIREAMKEGEKDLLREKIDSLLLIQRGKDLDIKVDNEVSKQLAEVQANAKIADPDKFQQWIRENVGKSYEDFKQELKNRILTQKVVGQEVGSKINIPREQVLDYYEKHKSSFIRKEQVFLREILIGVDSKDPAVAAAAEKKAKDVVARARKGERFGDLVRDNSDALTAKQGGDLPGYAKSDLSPELVAAVWDKPKGHVTDPIRVPSGFLILRVEDHFKEGQASLAEVEGEIKEQLYMPLFQPKIREYLTQLRQAAFLEIRDGYADTGAAPGKDTRWQDPALLKPDTVSKEEVSTRKRHKKLLWVMPIPGTQTRIDHTSSSRG
ncbi:MAG: peptidylprolyl isomerase [Bryobacteraceae bacterium]|jgi:parvulin-like peptidyl-prolyl isomerase